MAEPNSTFITWNVLANYRPLMVGAVVDALAACGINLVQLQFDWLEGETGGSTLVYAVDSGVYDAGGNLLTGVVPVYAPAEGDDHRPDVIPVYPEVVGKQLAEVMHPGSLVHGIDWPILELPALPEIVVQWERLLVEISAELPGARVAVKVGDVVKIARGGEIL